MMSSSSPTDSSHHRPADPKYVERIPAGTRNLKSTDDPYGHTFDVPKGASYEVFLYCSSNRTRTSQFCKASVTWASLDK